MLRLWPEEIHIGLFADHCWLRRGRRSAVYAYQPVAQGGVDGTAAALLQALAAILDAPENGVRPGARISVTVSDTLADIIALPWQDALRRPDERARYARLLFEQDGRDVAADAVLRADFIDHGALGLAFALPRAWMMELVASTTNRKLRLLRVLPASAAGFYLPVRGARGALRLLILEEPKRASALVFAAGRFAGIDVEPVIGAGDDALRRLLRRTVAVHGKLNNVLQWSSRPDGASTPGAILAAELPDAAHASLTREELR